MIRSPWPRMGGPSRWAQPDGHREAVGQVAATNGGGGANGGLESGGRIVLAIAELVGVEQDRHPVGDAVLGLAHQITVVGSNGAPHDPARIVAVDIVPHP